MHGTIALCWIAEGLLRNLDIECKRAVEEKWGLSGSKVRCYLHYQPSYYHLHVHVTALDFNPPGVNCEKSHLLDIVIANIEQDPNFYQKATLAFVTREKEMLYKAYKEHGYFEPNTSKQDFQPCLRMWESLGKAKHEPCGEFWETTYGESAWRMCVISLTLCNGELDMSRVIGLCLASSLTSLGGCNDENTEWSKKISDVTSVLNKLLPGSSAAKLGDLFEQHALIRRGKLDGSKEHKVYRGVLEMEETLLRWEEEMKETGGQPEIRELLKKMAQIRIPGWEQLMYLGDRKPLTRVLTFWLTLSKLQW